MGRRKKTPYAECVWETTYLNSEEYIITSPTYYDRSSYSLWKKISEYEWEKLGTEKTPTKLYGKYIKIEED